MNDGLSQMAAGGAVVGIVVTGEGRGGLFRLGLFLMNMVGAVAVMPIGLHTLMASLVLISRPVRVASRGKQTVRQMQEHCTEGDDFEMLAQHGSDSRQSAVASQLQLSCITTSAPSLLFSRQTTFYDDSSHCRQFLENPAKAPKKNEQHSQHD